MNKRTVAQLIVQIHNPKTLDKDGNLVDVTADSEIGIFYSHEFLAVWGSNIVRRVKIGEEATFVKYSPSVYEEAWIEDDSTEGGHWERIHPLTNMPMHIPAPERGTLLRCPGCGAEYGIRGHFSDIEEFFDTNGGFYKKCPVCDGLHKVEDLIDASGYKRVREYFGKYFKTYPSLPPIDETTT